MNEPPASAAAGAAGVARGRRSCPALGRRAGAAVVVPGLAPGGLDSGLKAPGTIMRAPSRPPGQTKESA